MDEITRELNEISRIIGHVRLMDAIKHEVRLAMGEQRALVTGGDLADAPEYDVVIRHKAGSEKSGEIVRRLNAMENIEVSLIERVADILVGIKQKEQK